VEENYVEEISLRECIEVLLRGKKIILAITLTAVLISAVFSFFIIQPTYEASITLMASAISKPEVKDNGEGVPGFLNSISDFPAMTLDTYKEQIKNPVILQDIIDELKLDPEEYTRRSLGGAITLETIKNTNLIKIKVKNNDPKLAADIANTLAKIFTEFVSDKAKEQSGKSYQFLEKQMNVEKGKLDQALVAYKEFIAKPRGVDELKAEVDSKLRLITDYKTQYVQKEVEERAKTAALEKARQELAATEKVLVTRKSLSEDAFLNQIISDAAGESALDTGQLTMESEEINPNYISLQSRISSLGIELAMLKTEKQNLKLQIESNSEELKALQADLAEKQHQENMLQQNIDLAQQTYDAFLSKYEEIRITQSSQVGDASIIIVSPAAEPLVPVAPRKMLNVAIAGVLGLMVSAFAVFFKEYWESSGNQKTGKSIGA